jgi:putative endonuclease
MEEKNSIIPGYVYILQSKLNSRYYIGSTVDIKNRFAEHQNGEVKSTKNIRPLQLKFFQKYDNVKYARQIEYKLKKMKNKKILDKIVQEQTLKLKLQSLEHSDVHRRGQEFDPP